MATPPADRQRVNKYAKLPEQIRPEDMITGSCLQPQEVSCAGRQEPFLAWETGNPVLRGDRAPQADPYRRFRWA